MKLSFVFSSSWEMGQERKTSDYNINFWELILYVLMHLDYLDKTVKSEKTKLIDINLFMPHLIATIHIMCILQSKS